ncbi:MAG: hypothetical protein HF962_00460, partial [Sulfurovum sp.]|nr:hypothetical protein [Sulfurovum sp.]
MENNPTILRLTPDLYKAMDADRRKKLSRAMQEGKVKVEVVVPESVDSLKTPAGSAKTPVPSGAAIAEAFAKGEKRLEEQKSKGWWDKAKDIVSEVRSGAKKAGAELMEPVAQGAQNVIDVISPIDVEVSKSPSIGDEISKELDNTIDKESTPYRVYERLGELSRTDRGFHDIVGGKASQEDVSTYKKNREHLLLDVMGYT